MVFVIDCTFNLYKAIAAIKQQYITEYLTQGTWYQKIIKGHINEKSWLNLWIYFATAVKF